MSDDIKSKDVIANILEKAAGIIEKRGIAKGKLLRLNGSCCVLGAIGLACEMDETVLSQEVAGGAYKTLDEFPVVNTFAEYIGKPLGKTSACAGWNDSIVHNYGEVQGQEMITNKLRETAAKLRTMETSNV